jgi:hypothetical protein
MSFLLFDPDFIDLLVEAGQRDAAAAVHAALPGEVFRLTRTPRGPVVPPRDPGDVTAPVPAR